MSDAKFPNFNALGDSVKVSFDGSGIFNVTSPEPTSETTPAPATNFITDRFIFAIKIFAKG